MAPHISVSARVDFLRLFSLDTFQDSNVPLDRTL